MFRSVFICLMFSTALVARDQLDIMADVPASWTYETCKHMIPESNRFKNQDIQEAEAETVPKQTTEKSKISLWSLPIRYKITDGILYNGTKLQILRCVFLFFIKNTCITFTPLKGDQKPYVLITDEKKMCHGMTGMFENDVSNATIGTEDCWRQGVLLHEIMHVLGFIHEHQRRDRDTYVTVSKEAKNDPSMQWNIGAQFGNNSFNPGKYDYGSIMHYGRGFNGREAITAKMEPIDANNAKVGQRVAPSEEDIHKIKILYKCKD